MFLVSIVLISNAISFPLLSLKIDSGFWIKKYISYSLWQPPPTLNGFLTTHMSHNNTEAALSPAVNSAGNVIIVMGSSLQQLSAN